MFRKARKIATEPELPNAGLSKENEPTSTDENDSFDVLNLGWYYSENKEDFQLAKIAEKDRATHLYVIGATGTGK